MTTNFQLKITYNITPSLVHGIFYIYILYIFVILTGLPNDVTIAKLIKKYCPGASQLMAGICSLGRKMKHLSSFKLIKFLFLFLVFTCEFISSEIPRPRGVSLSRSTLYNPSKDFTCFDGSLTIPFTQVNDDYCDCQDASDEPGTSACPHGIFYCLNAGYHPENIPSNRVNDGICDCCDTSDEYASSAKCVNTCEELGRSSREEAQRQAELIKIGSQIRLELSQKGAQLKQEKREKIQELERNKLEAEQVLLEKEALKKAAEEDESAALEYYRELERQRKEAEELNNQQEAIKKDIEEQAIIDGQDVNDEISEGIKENQDKAVQEDREDAQGQEEELLDGQEDVDNNPDDEDEEEDDASSTPATGDAEDTVQHQVYDEETQKLIDRANDARREFESARSVVQDITREVDSIREYLEKDFGPNDEFAPLEGQCFDYEDREYIYRLCPFDKTSQQPKAKHEGADTRLGIWSRWDGSDHNKYEMMVFENGQSCWNGPDRNTRVKVRCGSENKLTSVTEPNRCEYYFEFTTPAACREASADTVDLHDEL
ncbi:glucosidase 2 subunit beta [Agrilus planipennis]|uniref:Glucosidase 2 subunit beta n=1 Tax=Agrilus planipennis TaxID=224129 RepID=A0A1W4X6T4_AGRPL|nr:glucosidase 2 subunit beta [Agrilus planipennis]